MPTPIIQLFIGLVLFIVIFLILRMFWLWYWKIDKIVELLENINENTKNPIQVKSIKDKTPKKTIADESVATQTKKSAIIKAGLDIYDGDDGVDCPACKHRYNPNELKCTNCGRANPTK